MVKKIVVIPDSFKGCLSSYEVANIIKTTLNHLFPTSEILGIQVSDGGEGLVESYLAVLGGKKIALTTKGPYLEPIESYYGLLDGHVAVIEMAASAGLPLVKNQKNPSLTSTYGVGALIIDAINHGAKKIILGLGGSSTNDMGMGMASCLGVKFYNQNHELFLPVGKTLGDIADIKTDEINPQLANVEFITLCDVKNPLYGPTGAAYVFARQKGADDEMIKLLDENMRKLAFLLKEKFRFEANFEQAGAAGGMTVSTKLFLNSQIKSGITSFLEMINFAKLIKDADYIITGEGKLDWQSLNGKVIDGISRYADQYQIPLYAIVGQIDNLSLSYYPRGLTKVIELVKYSSSIEDAINNAPYYLRKATMEMAKSWTK
ncbi:MAG: glycerate kinase [Bacilli bacterium]